MGQLQPRRLREWVPGSSLLQTSNFSFLQLPQLQDQPTCQDGRVQDQAELPRGLRGVDQQADQHGILCLVRLSFHGFADHFKKESNEERARGMKLMEYQTKRGGRVVFHDIHKVAGDKGDGHLCDFLESEYLSEQVEGIKAVGDLITKMKRAGDGLGLHIIDKEMGS